MTAAAPQIDILAEAISITRRRILADGTTKERLRLLWAGAKHARTFGPADVVADRFIALARETGLRRALGRHADEDLQHVVGWACRGMNPWGAAR